MNRLAAAALLLAATNLAAKNSPFEQTVQPFLAKNCLQCHSTRIKTGGLDLERFRSASDVLANRETWERVAQRITSGEMPPKGLPRPEPIAAAAVTRWLENEFALADRNAKPDPGRVTARRLNRYEYNNTVRDLLAVSFRPADNFPADDSGYGFDNIGDVLSLSPALMEKYLAAAEKIAQAAIVTDALPKPSLVKHKRTEAPWGHSNLTVTHEFAVEGDYEFSINVSGRRDPLKLDLTLDGQSAGAVDVEDDPEKPRVVELKMHVARGAHPLEARLMANGPRKEESPPDSPGKAHPPPPNPFVADVEVRGPYHPVPPPPPESHRRIFLCGHSPGHHNAACARIDLADLARRAYRRPVTDREVSALTRFIDLALARGDSFEQGMRIALEAILVSPHFLFRIEGTSAAAQPIGEFELATRLSYFLWSSMPDEELFGLAAARRLRARGVLEAQVRRMLADSKAHALVENFGGQWLELRNLDSVKPDPAKFPAFTAEIRAAMKRESEMFFESIIREDRGIPEFLNAKYTYLNEPLAKFYGIAGVDGAEFRKVDLAGHPERGGILGQAAILTVSSYPTRTSPVIRGKWVLDNILNAPPPPPPPNVPNLEENGIGTTLSLREQLEKHRANAVCASCHSRMDPLGFGLENYDAIGRWRTHDGKFLIDASGVLPNGKSFQGPAELRAILLADQDRFAECLTEKLLTYALGRGLERYDKPTVHEIGRRAAAGGYRFSRLALEIVNSLPFEMRRGEQGGATQ